jgi:hypothetical protein
MDFITGLRESDDCTNLMVVTDRMSNGIFLVAYQQPSMHRLMVPLGR